MQNKKQGVLTGWSKVFLFTIKQEIKGKNFLLATLGGFFLFFAIVFGAYTISAFLGAKDAKDNDIKTVYYTNQSDMEVDFSDFKELEGFKDINFKERTETEDMTAKDLNKEDDAVWMKIYYKEDLKTYGVLVYFSKESDVSKDQAENLGECVAEYLEPYKLFSAGLDPESVQSVIKPVTYTLSTGNGEDQDAIAEILKLLGPMLVYFVLYFMILAYGQSISKNILEEKTNRVTEYLLTSIQPYSLVFGKLAAMIFVAICQFGLWIFGLIFGKVVGASVSKLIYKDRLDVIGKLFELFDLSPWVILISVLLMILGFIFYCCLAGLVAANVSKPEELSSAMGVFQLPMILSFFAVYMIPLFYTKVWIDSALRYVPFTSAYYLSAQFLVGELSFVQLIAPILIQLATIVCFVYWIGKLYKKHLFS